jgi:hypothetical protein
MQNRQQPRKLAIQDEAQTDRSLTTHPANGMRNLQADQWRPRATALGRPNPASYCASAGRFLHGSAGPAAARCVSLDLVVLAVEGTPAAVIRTTALFSS